MVALSEEQGDDRAARRGRRWRVIPPLGAQGDDSFIQATGRDNLL